MSKEKSQSTEAEVRAAATRAFGRAGEAYSYYTDDRSASVGVLIVDDSPVPGFQSCSTITLHTTRNEVGGMDVSVEFAAVSEQDVEWLPNLVATAAFYVMRDGWMAAPGVVFERLVEEFDPGTHLPHLLWTPPFPWDELHGLELENGSSVHWLLAMPISESERCHIATHGFDDFEDILAEHEVEYFNFARNPVV